MYIYVHLCIRVNKFTEIDVEMYIIHLYISVHIYVNIGISMYTCKKNHMDRCRDVYNNIFIHTYTGPSAQRLWADNKQHGADGEAHATLSKAHVGHVSDTSHHTSNRVRVLGRSIDAIPKAHQGGVPGRSEDGCRRVGMRSYRDKRFKDGVSQRSVRPRNYD